MRAAFACLALAYPTLASIAATAAAWAISSLTLDLTIAAVVFAARRRPHRAHRLITWLVGATIADLVTGHRLKSVTGPQIPA